MGSSCYRDYAVKCHGYSYLTLSNNMLDIVKYIDPAERREEFRMSTTDQDQRIAAIRHFNRFFTQKIGVLHEGLLKSSWSLAEVRVMYELAHRSEPTAAELCQALNLDAGYLSRILRRFDREKLLQRRKSQADARRTHLSLSRHGHEVFSQLDWRSHEDIAALLRDISDADQRRLVDAMQQVENILSRAPYEHSPWVLRQHRPGDMAWVTWQHSRIYQGEYGWNDRFIALVARVVADFIEHYDPQYERCWIAERDGQNIGSIFLVRESDELARLRMLLVTPEARGLGVGRRLVTECVETARALGYRRMTLWTNDVLHAARRLYEEAGFRLVKEEPHSDHGPELVGQDWELDLQGE